MSSFSNRTISSFESLILECSLENARQEQSRQASFMSDDTTVNTTNDASSMEMSPKDLDMLSKLPGNLVCIDCNSDDTEWASVSFGIFLCAECSGTHRSLGTHISRVRSVKMDSWSSEQLKMMRLSSNKQCRDFLEKHGLDFATISIRDRYSSAAAAQYHNLIKARVKENGSTAGSIQQDRTPPIPQRTNSNCSMDESGYTDASATTDDDNADDLVDDEPVDMEPVVGSPTLKQGGATVSDLAKAVQSSQNRTGTGSPRTPTGEFMMRDASMNDASTMTTGSMRDCSFRDFSRRDESMRDNSIRNNDESSRMNQYVQTFRERFAGGRGGADWVRGVGRTRSASSAASNGSFSGRQGRFGSRRSSIGGASPNRTRLTRSVSASAPTVTYLGRSFRADTFVSTAPSRRSSMDSTSCRSESAVSNEKSASNDSEFARLKASLKDAGAMTSMSIKLRLNDFANYNSSNNHTNIATNSRSTKSLANANFKGDKAPRAPRRLSRRASYSAWLGSSAEDDCDDDYQNAIVISPIA